MLIEFGSGTLSTLSLVDEVAFPSIQRVDSYENNHEWFQQVRNRLGSDARVVIQFVDGEMYQAVDRANTAQADLIFVDDSPTDKTRVPTVREVSRLCGKKPLVIMHDHDLWRLRLATRNFEHRVSFPAFNPQSCVMWHGHPERKPRVEEVSRIIQQHAPDISLTDIRGWMRVFVKELS